MYIILSLLKVKFNFAAVAQVFFLGAHIVYTADLHIIVDLPAKEPQCSPAMTAMTHITPSLLVTSVPSVLYVQSLQPS